MESAVTFEEIISTNNGVDSFSFDLLKALQWIYHPSEDYCCLVNENLENL
jgi:hypothetical protein